jgi:hypothetical protein
MDEIYKGHRKELKPCSTRRIFVASNGDRERLAVLSRVSTLRMRCSLRGLATAACANLLARLPVRRDE